MRDSDRETLLKLLIVAQVRVPARVTPVTLKAMICLLLSEVGWWNGGSDMQALADVASREYVTNGTPWPLTDFSPE